MQQLSVTNIYMTFRIFLSAPLCVAETRLAEFLPKSKLLRLIATASAQNPHDDTQICTLSVAENISRPTRVCSQGRMGAGIIVTVGNCNKHSSFDKTISF